MVRGDLRVVPTVHGVPVDLQHVVGERLAELEVFERNLVLYVECVQ